MEYFNTFLCICLRTFSLNLRQKTAQIRWKIKAHYRINNALKFMYIYYITLKKLSKYTYYTIIFLLKCVICTKTYFNFLFFAAVNVFFISVAIVIGPTPPGTGVIYDAFLEALSNSTSPTSFLFSSRFIPTSITTAPSLI